MKNLLIEDSKNCKRLKFVTFPLVEDSKLFSLTIFSYKKKTREVLIANYTKKNIHDYYEVSIAYRENKIECQNLSIASQPGTLVCLARLLNVYTYLSTHRHTKQSTLQNQTQ